MRIGLLSDSHGRADTTARAVATLLQHGAEMLIHLGDVGSEEVIEELVGHELAGGVRLVFGNCDWPVEPLRDHAEAMGLQVDHPLGRLTADGKTLAYTHGHQNNLVHQALAADPDYLLHGHTHETRDERLDGVRVINPGALFRASVYTVAILQPGEDRVEFLEINR